MGAAGILLVLLGAALLVAEAHVPSHGALGTAAVAALAGGLALVVAGTSVGLAAVVAAALSTAAVGGAFVWVIARKGLATRRIGPQGGAGRLIGRVGVVREAPAPLGRVLVDGGLWRARLWELDGEQAPAVGDAVVVEQVHGLTLTVRPAEEWEVAP